MISYCNMPFEKGSKEAKDWCAKMRAAKQSKQSGGKVKTPKEINRALRKIGDKMEHGFALMGENLNPFNQLLKNDKTSDLLVKSGELTNNYLLPATVSAFKPVGQAAATMFGGPLAGLAVDKAVNYGLSFGNNPEDNQKSKLLGNIASITGELAGDKMGGKIKRKTKRSKK